MSIIKKLAFLWSYSLLVIIIGGYYLGGWTWAGAFYELTPESLERTSLSTRRDCDRGEAVCLNPFVIFLPYFILCLLYLTALKLVRNPHQMAII